MQLRKYLIFALFFLTLVIASPLSAQEFPPPSVTTTKQKFPTGLSPQQKRELLQQRLQSITDTGKANIVLNINDKLTEINTQSTQQMTDALNQMSAVLNRLGGRLEEAKTQGLDTALAEQAFTDAQISLKTAQDAVASQSAIVYTIDASDSATLKAAVGKTISQLQSDLQAVRSLVIEAKQKIAFLIRELAKTGVGKIGLKDKSASSAPALIEPFIPR